jgi:hypothetical protein
MTTDDIIKADRLVKDTEIRLFTARAALEVVELELDKLKTTEFEVLNNLAYLKRKKVVTLAKEFKKIKEELTIIGQKLIAKLNERQDVLKACATGEKLLEEAKEKYESMIYMKENNVVEVNFRK